MLFRQDKTLLCSIVCIILLEAEVTHVVSRSLDHPCPYQVLPHFAILSSVTHHHLHRVCPLLGLLNGRVDRLGQEVSWLGLIWSRLRVIQLGRFKV